MSSISLFLPSNLNYYLITFMLFLYHDNLLCQYYYCNLKIMSKVNFYEYVTCYTNSMCLFLNIFILLHLCLSVWLVFQSLYCNCFVLLFSILSVYHFILFLDLSYFQYLKSLQNFSGFLHLHFL